SAQLFVQDLDRDRTAQRDLVGSINGAAAANADAGGELELVAEDSADQLQGLLYLVLNAHEIARLLPASYPCRSNELLTKQDRCVARSTPHDLALSCSLESVRGPCS